jgi:DNA-damage-inducible protein D
MENALAVFERYEIRRHYDEEAGVWYFSVVDIIRALIDQPDFQAARKYWNKLKERLAKEGSETVTKCHRLKMLAEDGKMRETDVADPETLLRLIQSVPSPKAEPIELWLAKVGHERMQEMADPERSLNRARETWRKHGRSEKWIQQRMMGQETRSKPLDFLNIFAVSSSIYDPTTRRGNHGAGREFRKPGGGHSGRMRLDLLRRHPA